MERGHPARMSVANKMGGERVEKRNRPLETQKPSRYLSQALKVCLLRLRIRISLPSVYGFAASICEPFEAPLQY